ncbi:lipopolysaccharide-induced tumor necrosis factor-alpha factor homolog [Anticarsia gemmatalis]|uniref:lipopolysaccharide-induced tumor necrosis factor-alpha factor homolog n=1 Tax=Anticarsia gemmatalis TaxID=129554 RepID=UPI003F76230D
MELNEPKMSHPQGNPPPYTAGPPAPTPVIVGVAPRTTTIIPVVVGQQMGPRPANIVCKSCNYQIVTRVETKASSRTHIFALILCLIGCWPCVCVPYCMDSCNNADHYCPNCSAYIGSYIN